MDPKLPVKIEDAPDTPGLDDINAIDFDTFTIVNPKELKSKRKTCDACVLRKVACRRENDHEPCVPCRKLGIRCVIIVKERKKYPPRKSQGGKRIDRAKAELGSITGSAVHTPLAAVRQEDNDFLPSARPYSETRTEQKLAHLQFEGPLVIDLLQCYNTLPHGYTRLVDVELLITQFEAVGRQFFHLSPEIQVLTATVVALSSYASTNPILFVDSTSSEGASSLQINDTSNTDTVHGHLQSFGTRRAQTCAELRRKAVDLAREYGTLTKGGRENMTSCFLLEKLVERTGKFAGKPYGSSFVTHLRELLISDPEATEALLHTQGEDRIPWCYILAFEALQCFQTGTLSSFTDADIAFILSPRIPDVPTCLLEVQKYIAAKNYTDIPFTDWLDTYLFNLVKLARYGLENLKNPYNRSAPLQPEAICEFMAQNERLSHMFGPMNHLAMTACSLACPPPNMKLLSHIIKLAHGSIIVPLYNVLVEHSANPAEAGLCADWLEEVKVLAEKSALLAAECMSDLPSVAILTHLMPLEQEMTVWAQATIEAKVPSNVFKTKDERLGTLQRLLAGTQAVKWAWVGDGPHTWTTQVSDKLKNAIEYERQRDVMSSRYPGPPVTQSHPSGQTYRPVQQSYPRQESYYPHHSSHSFTQPQNYTPEPYPQQLVEPYRQVEQLYTQTPQTHQTHQTQGYPYYVSSAMQQPQHIQQTQHLQPQHLQQSTHIQTHPTQSPHEQIFSNNQYQDYFQPHDYSSGAYILP